MDLANAQYWLREVEQELDLSERRLEVLQEDVRRLRGVEQALRLLLSSPGMIARQAEARDAPGIEEVEAVDTEEAGPEEERPAPAAGQVQTRPAPPFVRRAPVGGAGRGSSGAGPGPDERPEQPWNANGVA